MATTLGTRRSSKRTIQDTDFNGKPLTFQSELPATSGITTEYALPHPGDRITSRTYGTGTVLSVGEMAMWGQRGRRSKSIEVMFDSGNKWFISIDDLEEA